jgi:hypothetical protein
LCRVPIPEKLVAHVFPLSECRDNDRFERLPNQIRDEHWKPIVAREWRDLIGRHTQPVPSLPAIEEHVGGLAEFWGVHDATVRTQPTQGLAAVWLSWPGDQVMGGELQPLDRGLSNDLGNGRRGRSPGNARSMLGENLPFD